MPAVAVTDHGNMFGAFAFYHEAVKSGVRPILGVEAYIAPGDRRDREAQAASESGEGYAYHLTLLAATQDGLPQPRPARVRGVPDRLLPPPAHGQGAPARARRGADRPVGMPQGRGRRVARARQLRGRQDARSSSTRRSSARATSTSRSWTTACPQQTAIVPDLLRLSTRDGRSRRRDERQPLPAPRRRLRPRGAPLHRHGQDARGRAADALLQRRVLRQERRRDEDALPALVARKPCANSVAIAERCAVSLDTEGLHLPTFAAPPGQTPAEYFRELAREGLERRLDRGSPSPRRPEKYRERLEYEIGVVEKMGFPSYFLIVSDFIRYRAGAGDLRRARAAGAPPARSSPGPCGSRRSIPLRYDLLFERFLNPERISMPDIDIDFCQARRGEVIEYVTKKYGRENVAQIVTFSQLKPKLAVRDVARVLSLPVALGDRIAKLVPGRPRRHLRARPAGVSGPEGADRGRRSASPRSCGSPSGSRGCRATPECTRPASSSRRGRSPTTCRSTGRTRTKSRPSST